MKTDYGAKQFYILPKNKEQSSCYPFCSIARVAELVDAPDLGSGAVRREGSTPSSGTK